MGDSPITRVPPIMAPFATEFLAEDREGNLVTNIVFKRPAMSKDLELYNLNVAVVQGILKLQKEGKLLSDSILRFRSVTMQGPDAICVTDPIPLDADTLGNVGQTLVKAKDFETIVNLLHSLVETIEVFRHVNGLVLNINPQSILVVPNPRTRYRILMPNLHLVAIIAARQPVTSALKPSLTNLPLFLPPTIDNFIDFDAQVYSIGKTITAILGNSMNAEMGRHVNTLLKPGATLADAKVVLAELASLYTIMAKPKSVAVAVAPSPSKPVDLQEMMRQLERLNLDSDDAVALPVPVQPKARVAVPVVVSPASMIHAAPKVVNLVSPSPPRDVKPFERKPVVRRTLDWYAANLRAVPNDSTIAVYILMDENKNKKWFPSEGDQVYQEPHWMPEKRNALFDFIWEQTRVNPHSISGLMECGGQGDCLFHSIATWINLFLHTDAYRQFMVRKMLAERVNIHNIEAIMTELIYPDLRDDDVLGINRDVLESLLGPVKGNEANYVAYIQTWFLVDHRIAQEWDRRGTRLLLTPYHGDGSSLRILLGEFDSAEHLVAPNILMVNGVIPLVFTPHPNQQTIEPFNYSDQTKKYQWILPLYNIDANHWVLVGFRHDPRERLSPLVRARGLPDAYQTILSLQYAQRNPNNILFSLEDF